MEKKREAGRRKEEVRRKSEEGWLVVMVAGKVSSSIGVLKSQRLRYLLSKYSVNISTYRVLSEYTPNPARRESVKQGLDMPTSMAYEEERKEARNDDTSSISTPFPKHILLAVPLLRVVFVEGWTDHSCFSQACIG